MRAAAITTFDVGKIRNMNNSHISKTYKRSFKFSRTFFIQNIQHQKRAHAYWHYNIDQKKYLRELKPSLDGRMRSEEIFEIHTAV